MAAFPFRGGRIRLVRNHEVGAGRLPFDADLAYDPKAGGGTTTLEFDSLHRARWCKAWASISGTVRNCAGGPTPWGSWLTCEETIDGPSRDERAHAAARLRVRGAGGRHGDARSRSATWAASRTRRWRSIPPPATSTRPRTPATTPGSTASFRSTPGTCTSAARLLHARASTDSRRPTRARTSRGRARAVEWVPIADARPRRPGAAQRLLAGLRRRAGRASRASRAAGTATGASTSPPPAAATRARARSGSTTPPSETLRLLFESPGGEVLNAPDNLCVSPRGGLVLCEDGSGLEFIHGLTDGRHDLPLRAEQRRPERRAQRHRPATSAAPSSRARPTARTAAGCSSTSSRRASRSR